MKASKILADVITWVPLKLSEVLTEPSIKVSDEIRKILMKPIECYRFPRPKDGELF